ncbi:MAG: SDR family oxidoreductase [Pyrinomonadaceae bacterium]
MINPVSEERSSIWRACSPFAPESHFFAAHAYAASKGAVIALTKSMASYYAPQKIRANVIAPALVRTPMSVRAQENAEIMEFIKVKQSLAEGMIDAFDVARASLFLLGEESGMITGEVMTIDAGWCVSG